MLLTILLTSFLSFFSSWGNPAYMKVSKADADKADYMYLEAASAIDREEFERGYMLLRKANALNPFDPYIAARLGEVILALPTADNALVEKSYQSILWRFSVDPADEINANTAASLAAQRQDYDMLINIWSKVDSVSPKRTDAALNLADALMQRYSLERDSADSKRAMDVLDRLERLAGPTTPITMRKISAYLLDRDTAAAISQTEKYLSSAPADPSVMMNAGLFYEHLSLPDSAQTYYDKAVALDADNGAIHIARANFFNRQNDSIAFDSEIVRALESTQLDFSQKMPLLAGYVKSLYADTTNWERIDRMFGVMQEVNAGEPDLHDYYAYFKAFQGNNRGAAEQLAYAIDLDPTNIERRRQLIGTLYAIPDSAAARSAAWQLHHEVPSDVQTTLFLASSEAQAGREKTAIAMLDSIPVDTIADKQILSMIFATKGDILSRTQQLTESAEAYLKSLEYDPSNYMTMNNLAYHYAVADTLLDKAEMYASMAVSSDTSNPTYLDTYAWVFFKQKNYPKAKEYIDMALEAYAPARDAEDETAEEENADGPTFEIYDHAGDIYFMNGEYEQALSFWEKALELKPDDSKIKQKVKHKAYIPD